VTIIKESFIANSKEKQQDKKTEQAATPTSKSMEKPNKAYLPIISLLVAGLAVATVIYTFYLNQQLHENFKQLQQQQSTLESNLDNAGLTLKETEKELQEKLDDLQQQLKLSMEQRTYDNQDWMLLKARYYLELAQINAHWSDNTATTLALLKQADTILSKITAKNVLKIRQAIASEMSALKAVPQPDLAGLLSRLDAASQTIDDLPVTLSITKKEKNSLSAENKTKDSVSSALSERLQDSVNMLEKLVVIRRHDEDIKPLLSPLYTAVIRENIRMNLQEAQWAILKKNDAVYQIALNQAIENVKRNFDTKADVTTALLKQLNQLKEKNIKPQQPQLNQSLPLLNQLIQKKEPSTETGQATDSQGESH